MLSSPATARGTGHEVGHGRLPARSGTGLSAKMRLWPGRSPSRADFLHRTCSAFCHSLTAPTARNDDAWIFRPFRPNCAGSAALCTHSLRSVRLFQAKQKADPHVEARLLAAVEAVLPGALKGLSPQQISEALAYVTFQIGEATDLFHNPDRCPGWVLEDPTTLQALGQASRQNTRSIVALAADRARLAASRLNCAGRTKPSTPSKRVG